MENKFEAQQDTSSAPRHVVTKEEVEVDKEVEEVDDLGITVIEDVHMVKNKSAKEMVLLLQQLSTNNEETVHDPRLETTPDSKAGVHDPGADVIHLV